MRLIHPRTGGWYFQRDDATKSILYPALAAALAAQRNDTIQWEEKTL